MKSLAREYFGLREEGVTQPTPSHGRLLSLAANALWSIVSKGQKQVPSLGEGGRGNGMLPFALFSWPAFPFACGHHARLWEGLGRHQPPLATTFHSVAQPSKFAGTSQACNPCIPTVKSERRGRQHTPAPPVWSS